jgi:2-iminobutanoate/2-iminopropanoate deaminase
MKQPIMKPNVPPSPIYSPGINANGFIFVSGQGPLKPGSRQVIGETIEDQAKLTMENVKTVLTQAGCTMDDCVKVNVYLTDLSEYDRFNTVYQTFFKSAPPARTLIGCQLVFGIKVEIDAIAVAPIK